MNYPRLLVAFIALTALAVLSACQPKSAATPTDTSSPVATVNGTPITRNFYEFYIKQATGKTSADLNAQQRTAALDNLIRGQLIADQAVKDGVDKSDDVPSMLELARLSVLQQAVSESYLKDRKPTDQELRAEYENEINQMPKFEYHAEHILVATEPFAEKVIEQLGKGAKWDDLAKKDSMDPSKSNGGDLGWLALDRMPPEFAAALQSLKPGEYTHKPVQTQYGWHIIRLVETRDVTPPPYDQVKQRLVQVVEAKKFRAYADDLVSKAKIEKFLDQPAPAKAPAAGTAPTPTPSPATPAPTPAPAPAPKN
ncbi:MAG TPA: peptidylprolyl isomerase [Steroidobacteraceae bacterium]|nr:peptidylprolyl isomerase [Steroidobacteraceae bacterium]